LRELDPASVSWDGYHKNNFPFVLRQDPGPRNALGLLKFGMPNPFAIFLHGTPDMTLFNKPVRTLSSGCIRVEQPLRLAARLLGKDPLAAEAQLHDLIAAGDTVSIPVQPQVPVYLLYLTAWVDDQGNLQFRNDVYGRNVSLRDRFSIL
jgi:murein L,D-transpeptidase YcbB/YkuD